MHIQNVYNTLTPIFQDAFDSDTMQLSPELTAQDIPGWDSFKQIEIILTVERQFGIKLPSREIDRLHCVGDLANIIAERATE